MEFRSTRCVMTTRPSAIVKTGFSRIWASGYSPSRNVVACQVVSFSASRWTNSCTDMLPSGSDFGMSVRKESTITMRGESSSTFASIASRTLPRSFVRASSVRFANCTTLFTFAMSKNVNCCWYRSILSVGSPSTVKYTAGRSGVAFANMNWWASVVLPHPGSPTMRLNEYSGQPPPRMASSFPTPEGSRLMDTFRDSLIDHLRSWLVLGQHRDAPCLLHERKHQVVADKRSQQVDVICQYGREAIFHGLHVHSLNAGDR